MGKATASWQLLSLSQLLVKTRGELTKPGIFGEGWGVVASTAPAQLMFFLATAKNPCLHPLQNSKPFLLWPSDFTGFTGCQ